MKGCRLQNPSMVPRPAYNRYLQGLVENGFGKRVLFGSDFPNLEEAGIDAVLSASFLSVDQKPDILCENAARFLRLKAETCNP
jgi:predicted TIM-barrel fold metal-dependent hydrolase